MNEWTIFGHPIYLTLGPLFTIIVGPLIVYAIKRYIKQNDDARKAEKAKEEEALLARHTELKADIELNRVQLTDQLKEFCRQQERIHAAVDNRFWRHSHTESGDIVIRQNGGASGI